jgi:hypothetical protein
VNFDFTLYQKRSRDALISVPLAPSSAASDLSVLRNIGRIQNRGLEATIGGSVLNYRRFSYELSLSGSYNDNKIRSLGLDLAGNPNKTIGTGTIRDSVGFPIDAFFYRTYTYNDANHDGYIVPSEITEDTTWRYVGSPVPKTAVSLANTFGFFNNQLRINALFDFKGDFYVEDVNNRFLCVNQPAASDRSNLATSVETQAKCVAARSATPYTTTYGYIEKGNFVRWRELSAVFALPPRYARAIHSQRANLALGGRNLAVWAKTFKGQDPEANYQSGNGSGLGSNNQLNIASSAPRTYYTLRLNLYF